MALSKKFREKQNVTRRDLLRRLTVGDSQFVKLLVKWVSETDCNRPVSEHFGLGKTKDLNNMHRKNLRGLRLRKSKLSAADIAWALEDSLDGADPADLGINIVTKAELAAFLRLNTLLFILMESYS